MAKKKGEGLDFTYHNAHEVAKKTRKRKVPWSQQLAFFEEHRDEFGDLWELGISRAEMGYAAYGDDMFWYPYTFLHKMFEEEIADAIVYHTVLKYRYEVIGAEEFIELDDSDCWEDPD